MERKSLIVPLVGDFAGPTVIRNVGRYLTEHKTTVSVFYISNVETYLDDTQKQAFYANVTTGTWKLQCRTGEPLVLNSGRRASMLTV